MVGNIQTTIAGSHEALTINKLPPAAIDDVSVNAATSASSSLPTISTLSHQLSDSATRAEVRDSNLNHRQLGELARKLDDQFSGERYFANKAKHDSEVPKTDDPELLARAKHATDYVKLTAGGDRAAKSPFDGLSREQLNLIAYDDSGSYTVNERRAAWVGTQTIEAEWRQKVVAQGMEESNSTGKSTAFFTEVLAHYKTLPRIEQAQYPEGYAADLQSKIAQGADSPGRRPSKDLLSLAEFLVQARMAEKQTPSTPPQFTTNNLSPNASPTQAAVPRS
jgi:hypothetical protein